MSKPQRLFINSIPRIDISEYVREFIVQTRKKEGRLLNANHLVDAMRMKDRLNCPESTVYKSVRDIRTGFFYWNEQGVDYVPSNLGNGRGYLFYFICNGCGHRAKHLYEYSGIHSPLCRKCCHLHYRGPTRKERDLSRWGKKPYLSSEAKYMMAKRFGITKEDIPDENEGGLKML